MLTLAFNANAKHSRIETMNVTIAHKKHSTFATNKKTVFGPQCCNKSVRHAIVQYTAFFSKFTDMNSKMRCCCVCAVCIRLKCCMLSTE